MNDKQVQFFLSVADEGSFSKAERVEFVTKQAILKQINALEEEIGVPLLLRTPEGVTLTAAGQEFYRGARKYMELKEDIFTRCRMAPTRQPCIRIGQVEHQALLHRVTDLFSAKYPDIRIQKVIHPNHSSEYRVRNDIVDVGETFYTAITAQEPFAYTKLVDMPYVAAMDRAHPLSGRSRLTLQALSPYPTTVFQQMTPQPYLAALQEAFAEAPDHLSVRRDVDNQVATAYACAGTSRVFLTANCFVWDMPELTAVPLDTGWTQEYGIIYRPNPSQLIQKYVDLAVSVYQDGPSR